MKPLPPREGLGASTVQLPEGRWPSILAFLCHRFPGVAEAEWRSRIARGRVVDETGHAIGEADPYRVGLKVHYYRELGHEVPIPFEAEVLYRDEDLLVADKPHFLPVMPAGRFVHETLLVRLKQATGCHDLVPLHRIDRETAGLVLFSCNPRTRAVYQALFPQRAVTKVYEALAPPLPQQTFPIRHRSRLVPGEPFFRMCESPGVANSETGIEVLETREAHWRYRLTPVTGRKHQLRVHLAALGAPILNDAFYPTLREVAADDFSRPLQLLARSLSFADRLSGRSRQFESRRRLMDSMEW